MHLTYPKVVQERASPRVHHTHVKFALVLESRIAQHSISAHEVSASKTEQCLDNKIENFAVVVALFQYCLIVRFLALEAFLLQDQEVFSFYCQNNECQLPLRLPLSAAIIKRAKSIPEYLIHQHF